MTTHRIVLNVVTAKIKSDSSVKVDGLHGYADLIVKAKV